MASFDPYSTLGVSKTSTQDEIKAAYRKLAKKLHPDLNPGNKEAESKFKGVNRAYELIGTPEAKLKFDRGETQEQQEEAYRRGGPSRFYETQNDPHARYSNSFEGFDPSIFEDLFGTRARGQNRARGEDHQYSMEIDFNTSILGAEREITLPGGERLRVKIPPGIREGQKLRFAGKGTKGTNGQAGDAYVEIKVNPSPLFRRTGTDLEIDLPLSLPEVLLGGEVKVPTVDGQVMVKIPKGINSGSRIRLKGKGVPSNSGPGDLFAVVKIIMPEKIDPDLEDAVRKWNQTHSYNPRTQWETNR
jgi:DnaJ-class molecular chaperone